MHFYWRVIEELKYLGENWIIHDPGLLRNYRGWIERKGAVIAMSEEGQVRQRSSVIQYRGFPLSEN